jgi:lipopolysaccharide transport system permease protein
MSTKEAAINLSSDLSQSRDDGVVFPDTSPRHLAWLDIKSGILNWRIWLMLAYQDIKLRYLRSVLGPFWITISMAITTYSMGYLYSHLFHMNIGDYFPYLVAGMLSWSLISNTITEMADTLMTTEGLIKQIKLPYSLYVHRIAAKNMLIFFHNILVIVPVMFIFPEQVNLGVTLFLLIPGLFILYFNSITYGLVLAMIGGRYRDISQIIKSFIQVVFFVTPIMWKPDVLPPAKRFIANWNPMYCLIEMIRAPLIGYLPTVTTFVIVALVTVFGLLACSYLFVSRRARIIYWL